MSQYYGLVPMESLLALTALVKNPSTGAPINGDSAATFRVYGPSGLMPGATGTMAFKDTGAITGASDATPIVITSAGHGLTTGARVTITGVVGNTAANGTWIVNVIDANTFSLVGSAGNGAYSSGGVWNLSGLYGASFTVGAAGGFQAGQTYSVLTQALVSASQTAELSTFTVV